MKTCSECGGELSETNLIGNHYFYSECVKVLKSRLSVLEEENRWIPVEERLPEKDSVEVWEMYLCKLNRYGDVLVAPLYFIGGGWYSGNHSKYDEFVIEWKPLPPPTEETK